MRIRTGDVAIMSSSSSSSLPSPVFSRQWIGILCRVVILLNCVGNGVLFTGVSAQGDDGVLLLTPALTTTPTASVAAASADSTTATTSSLPSGVVSGSGGLQNGTGVDPVNNSTSTETDNCWNSPCVRGDCHDIGDDFRCDCPRKFEGKRCDIDLVSLYGCGADPCLHGGTCSNQTNTGTDGRNYRCTCAEGYTGVDCDTKLDLCRTTPCVNSQCVSGLNGYQCDCAGSGYTGDMCEQDVNECTSQTSICGSNRCSNHPGGFSCNCPDGYEGAPCQEIDECASNPCHHGATCNDGINQYTCECVPGYTGRMCQTDVDDCTDATSCTDPNTRCVDEVNGFRCECLDGFNGDPSSCVNINECDLGVCLNNATCHDSQGSYRCDCLAGFASQNCEINIDECANKPCLNNASCTDLVNDYSCSCLDGFRGKNCQEDIDDCENVNCRNGAPCTDKVNDFECACQTGWEGRYCGTNIDDCDPNPCRNRARCVDKLGGFMCECRPGYNGTTCGNNINDCLPNPCQNQGVCYDGVDKFSCNCTDGWMGKTCSEPYDACSFQPCLNDGNCTTRIPLKLHSCNCLVGFSGDNCEENIDDCVDVTCESYQMCYDGINTYTCGCPIGYSGDRCETEINECDANPCRNNGTCNDMTGDYNCTCKQEIIDISKEIGPKGVFLSGFNGTDCEHDINECAYSDPPICQNSALCTNSHGSFECYCKAVSDDGSLNVGKFCESQKTYCDLAEKECANGGTCVEMSQDSKCQCAPGFTDRYCETDIDECEPKPCHNGGTCSDRINGYECECIEGFTGPDCDINIDDCLPDPCNNGGLCQDGINSFSCNCSDTGFNGGQCENNIDDCVGNPCQHGGTCNDGVKEYQCKCLPGYTGANCEIDISECASVPCFNGSLCLEYSNESLYDKDDPRFKDFSYEAAAGYVCDCIPGLKGVNCTEDVNECDPDPCVNGARCDNRFNYYFCYCAPGYRGKQCESEIDECQDLQPCKNGGECTDRIADYSCTCPEPAITRPRNYGGKDCTTYLQGCDNNNRCGRNGDCLPKLVSEEMDSHSFSCVCHVGYTGDFCDKSTVFNFPKESYVSKEMDEFKFDLSLRFRTTLADALLVLCDLGGQGWIAVRIHQGMIEFKHYYPGAPVTWTTIDTSMPVNDAVFHTLKVVLTHNITVILPNDPCTGGGGGGEEQQQSSCLAEQSYLVTPSPSTPYPYLYIGSASVTGITDKTDLNQYFIGCMEDVIFNGDLLYPGLSVGEYYSLSPGCYRKIQCEEDTCNGRGACQDLWNQFQCDCHRPYYGDVCDKDYTPATFGGKPDEYALFDVFNRDGFHLSFLVTTRQTEGLIAVAENNQVDRPTFLSIYIKDGLLHGDLVICDYINQFSTPVRIDDGKAHLVEVSVKEKLSLSVNSVMVYVSEDITVLGDSVCEQIGYYATRVLIGNKDSASSSRRKRQANSALDVINENKGMNAFEGVIQDLRVNNFKLLFSANSTEDGLKPNGFTGTIGAHSTRDVCTDDTPCQNGGSCSNEFYNDFSCDCKRGYRGKNCSELDFCSYGSCPLDQSTCVNIQEGYECVSTAQFSGASLVTFSLSGDTNPFPRVTIKFRTRAQFGVLFFASRDDYFIKLRLNRGVLEMNYKLTLSEFSKTALTLPQRKVNDGEWYTAVLEAVVGNASSTSSSSSSSLLLKLSVLHKDVSVTNVKTVAIGSAGVDSGLDVSSMLVSGPRLTLGGTSIDPRSPVNRESRFVGCIEQARIGGVLLPFFSDDEFQNNTVPVRYLMQDKVLVSSGCSSPDMCQTSKCANGGQCIDTWYASHCQCQPGYQGDYCEENPNNCLGEVCSNQGRCVDGLDNFSCQCPTGFTGDRCQTDVSFCSSNNNSIPQCSNNGQCVEETNGFRCNCTQEFTGRHCRVQINQSCSQGLCQNVGTCKDVNVSIGGSREASFECECSGGFEGPLCEVPINGCDMQPPPCANGGSCTMDSMAPYYTCDCSSSADFEGQNCTERIDDCVRVTCGGNGICVDGHRKYTCSCNENYTGQNCETLVDNCPLSPCQYGVCKNNVCKCQSGYEGDYCEVEINECNRNVCVNAKSCDDLEGGFNCTCSLGYTGEKCDTPDCTDVCLNGAYCRTNATNWWCDCLKFYDGFRCGIKGPCADNPCNASNTVLGGCSQNIKFDNYSCDCKSGWEGKDCDQNINECLINTHKCRNGTCIDTPGSYRCDCIPGYNGIYCGQDIDECETDPCEHGLCANKLNAYECDCTNTGFNGTNCNEDINECQTTPDICHKGTCVNNPGSFDCDCGMQYLGGRCEYTDPCFNATCNNGGTCMKNQTGQNGAYVRICACPDGYEGVTCEKTSASKSDSSDTDIALIIGPIVGAVVFIIIIIILIAFVLTARSKRATRGAYSPSQQETSGSRVELGNVLKKPPEERLI